MSKKFEALRLRKLNLSFQSIRPQGDYILGNSLQSSEQSEHSRKYIKGKKCVYQMRLSRYIKTKYQGARKLILEIQDFYIF